MDDSGFYLVDIDSNKYIIFDEFYDFLKKCVCGLVKIIKGKD